MKKIVVRFLIIVAILIPIAAVAHYAVFPQTTRCMLIGFSDFEQHQSIYFPSKTSMATQENACDFVREGKARVESLFGKMTGSPVIIYCNTKDEFDKYGSEGNSPAVTQLSLFGEFIVLNGKELNKDVIAHEMCHAELQSEIGWYNRSFKIPAWFDEGLAMQVDNRDYYSEDSFNTALSHDKQLPDITKMTTSSTFNAGSDDEIWLHYAAAKHEIGHWYSKEKLITFITMINDGKAFSDSFRLKNF